MNMSDLKEMRKSLKKFFMDPNGEIITTEGLHEGLAREICKRNNWAWTGYSAEDYLINNKEYIKYSNYDGQYFRFIAVSSNAGKEVKDKAYFLSDMFNLRIEWYD